MSEPTLNRSMPYSEVHDAQGSCMLEQDGALFNMAGRFLAYVRYDDGHHASEPASEPEPEEHEEPENHESEHHERRRTIHTRGKR